jgi:hypothetical protein
MGEGHAARREIVARERVGIHEDAGRDAEGLTL